MIRSISHGRYDAVLFDMDGVLADTSAPHARSWKEAFDSFLASRPPAPGEDHRPFDLEADYVRHAEGRLRDDGARELLRSRGITLPEGNPGDPPERETVRGLASRKNQVVLSIFREGGVGVFPGSVRMVEEVRAMGLKSAVVSASHNVKLVLGSAGLLHLFDAMVDGHDLEREGLPGKPAPDAFLLGARRLGVQPGRAAVVEDAAAGVQAARRGGFGLVIGVDRRGDPGALEAAGAQLVVKDLSELLD